MNYKTYMIEVIRADGSMLGFLTCDSLADDGVASWMEGRIRDGFTIRIQKPKRMKPDGKGGFVEVKD